MASSRGGTLTVNVRVGGELRVESPAGGWPLPGYRAAECLPVRGDGLPQAVKFSLHKKCTRATQ